MTTNKPIMTAKLPPRKGHVERVDENGNHYYKRIEVISGYIARTIILTNDQDFSISNKIGSIRVTCVGGGGSKTLLGNGASGTITQSVLIPGRLPKSIHVTIGNPGTEGHAGEPTSFGTYVVANGGGAGDAGDNLGNSDGYIMNNKRFGFGETDNQAACKGVCIIEYNEPIYE